jgi:regulator of protease activity HflC (stomatin/prohibitin superfamily)
MSLILSALIALVSFVIFFTLKVTDGDTKTKSLRYLALLIGSLFALSFVLKTILRFLVIIPAGEVGVSETLGTVSTNTLNPGVHLVNPLTDVETFSTRLQDIKETVDTTSKEGLTFNIDVSLQYRLNPQKAGEVYQKIGDNEEEIIVSRFRSLIRQITAQYDLKTIYGEKRAEISQNLKQKMAQELEPLGFIVEETLLRNIILPENIQASIQSKVTVEQENQKLDLEIAKARKDAERKKIEAQGVATSQKILADGLTDQVLKLKAIEATQKLAESQNSKIIIIGGGQDKLPIILPDNP